MNSHLMPSPESSNFSTYHEPQSNPEAAANGHQTGHQVAAVQGSNLENSHLQPSDTSSNETEPHRVQPIPPPSEAMQYRAIGLVRGRYLASSEQFTQGTLITTDGVTLNAVLLGRIMSLVKNHLDLQTDHLWVVYPRTRQENDTLHLQIVGVWEPENLAKHSRGEDNQDSGTQELHKTDDPQPENQEESTSEVVSSGELPDGTFSVRGEVVYQSFDAKSLVVKIKQAPRKTGDKPKYFKLKLRGVLSTKAVSKFWDFQAKREGDVLVVEKAEAIADLPKKRKPPFKGGPRAGARKPFKRRGNGETPKPIKKTAGEPLAVSKPIAKAPTPKPIKRPKPTQE
jgi:hypothetical protein